MRRAAAALELDELLDRKPRQLSGGQQQRVALGRALVRDPQVFLMDEPLSNLDAKLRVQTRGEIKRLQQEIGTTTVYVTHDQVEAMTMGDRIAVMNDGRLEQVGTPAELYDEPANRVRGRLHRLARDELRARRRGSGSTSAPRPAIVGVRPEYARLWRGRACSARSRARSSTSRRSGARRSSASTGDRVVLCVEGRAAAQVGRPVRYGLVREGLRFFDPEIGARKRA